jgi:hypothetical protein
LCLLYQCELSLLIWNIDYIFETLKKDKLLKGGNSVAKIVAFLGGGIVIFLSMWQ